MNLRNLVAYWVASAAAFNRVNESSVVQSVVFLALIRDEAIYVGRGLAEDTPAGSCPVKENAEAAGDVLERDRKEIKTAPVSPVV